MRYPRVTIAMGLATFAASVWGCNGSSNGQPPVQVPTVEQCVKSVGWQLDAAVAATVNGIANAEGEACTDASTVEWYEESDTTNDFTHVMAWDEVGMCGDRDEAPEFDDDFCTFVGTHTWEAIPGVDPTTRMAMTETIATVNGDFEGTGADSQCGPASVLAGTTTRYLVELSGACQSGTRVWMWTPDQSDTEAVPGNVLTDPSGWAIPNAICTKPGTMGPSDHMPGRKICRPALVVKEAAAE